MRLPDFVCGCGVHIIWARLNRRRLPLEFDPDGDLTVIEELDGDWRVYDPETDEDIVPGKVLAAAGVKTLRSHLYRCGRLRPGADDRAFKDVDPEAAKVNTGGGLNRAQRRALAKRSRRKKT